MNKYQIAREVIEEFHNYLATKDYKWLRNSDNWRAFDEYTNWLDQQQAEGVMVVDYTSGQPVKKMMYPAEQGIYPSKIIVRGITGGKWYVPEEQQAEEEE